MMQNLSDNVNQFSANSADDDVLELIHSIMHQYRALKFQVLKEGELDLTHLEAKLLFFFSRNPGATQTDLVKYSGRDKAQLARLIKGLRERDLLVAEADAEDKRTTRLYVSARGSALHQAVQQQSQQLRSHVADSFSSDEQQQLRALLLRLQTSLGDFNANSSDIANV